MDNLKGIQVISGIQRYLKNSQLYAILGAQNENEMGRLLLYRSQDVVDWHFEGEIKTNLTQFGYMWECPDYFRLGNKDVILMCPQGVEAEGDKYRNIYQSGYMIGDLNFNNLFSTMKVFKNWIMVLISTRHKRLLMQTGNAF